MRRPISALPVRRLRPKLKRWQPLLGIVIHERAYDRAPTDVQWRARNEMRRVLFDLQRGLSGRQAKLRARQRQRGRL